MQNCPECDSATRDGARFCTSCGHRFPNGDNTGPTGVAEESQSPGVQAWRPVSAPDETLGHEGWPTVPSAAEPSGSWLPIPPSAPPGDHAEPSPPDENSASFWPESATDPWPSPPSSAAVATDPIPDNTPAEPVLTSPDPDDEEEEQLGPSRALALLDQLRAAIATLGTNPPLNLGSVISDLEVAATPPGAMAPDDLAELRDAIFAAREHPRDIDTIVDLTRRIDGLAALVIAYDRSIAAIERSLTTLKSAENAAAAEQPLPTTD